MHRIDRPSYLISIDGGTESLRVGLLDLNGVMKAKASMPYKTMYPKSGWAEQNPEDWWVALVEATRACLKHSSVPAHTIAGICCDATTCTLIPLGQKMQPLCPALLWMDVRASEQAERIFQTGNRALRYSPAGCNAEWMLSKALWLYENDRETYENTAYFVEYLDWLNFKLTGTLVLNLNTATQRWYYNSRDWGWPNDLFSAVGLENLAERIPVEILPPGQQIGYLNSEAAEALEMHTSVPVFQGAGDAFISLLGLNVIEEGRLGLIAGSSNVIAGFSKRNVHGQGVYGAFPDALIPDLWLLEAGQAATGSMLAWFKKFFAPETEFASLDEEAGKTEPGAGGVIALDYFQGNRSPHSDSYARGALWGLSLHTTRAHLFRALLEAIAYGTCHVLESFTDLGCPFRQIHACGGATSSDLLMQITADVCNVPISLTSVPDAALLGGAVLSACGLGIYPDMQSASANMVKISRIFTPNLNRQEEYRFYYDLYKETYRRLGGLMHDMTSHQNRVQQESDGCP